MHKYSNCSALDADESMEHQQHFSFAAHRKKKNRNVEIVMRDDVVTENESNEKGNFVREFIDANSKSQETCSRLI